MAKELFKKSFLTTAYDNMPNNKLKQKNYLTVYFYYSVICTNFAFSKLDRFLKLYFKH